ncbi:hypothetical protein [Kineococcus sp. SYSU DK006]|uniref:hypothetical protein n=1 Tax=Kineococcus sp. SYSU DK006 TaxID=3383127 RepID=UPI003D7E419A
MSQVQHFRLEDMVGGWFVGAFQPTAHHSSAAEVAVKHYRRGETEARHEHRIATEVTLLVSGRALMCGRELEAGDILVLPPFTATGFTALIDCTTVAVKTPSVSGDKHLVPEDEEQPTPGGDPR